MECRFEIYNLDFFIATKTSICTCTRVTLCPYLCFALKRIGLSLTPELLCTYVQPRACLTRALTSHEPPSCLYLRTRTNPCYFASKTRVSKGVRASAPLLTPCVPLRAKGKGTQEHSPSWPFLYKSSICTVKKCTALTPLQIEDLYEYVSTSKKVAREVLVREK